MGSDYQAKHVRDIETTDRDEVKACATFVKENLVKVDGEN